MKKASESVAAAIQTYKNNRKRTNGTLTIGQKKPMMQVKKTESRKKLSNEFFKLLLFFHSPRDLESLYFRRNIPPTISC
jgi:hypothetical protein